MSARMPRLHLLRSIWGMDRRQSDGREWSLSERFAMIHAAGFAGIGHHSHTAAEVETWIDEARDYGFVIEGQCFPRTVDELWPTLELAGRYGVHHLTVQADVRPYGVEGCIPILEGWRRLARAAGDSLTFLCELGPKAYAISGPDGNDLSDRWAEARQLKAGIEALWAGLADEAVAAGAARDTRQERAPAEAG